MVILFILLFLLAVPVGYFAGVVLIDAYRSYRDDFSKANQPWHSNGVKWSEWWLAVSGYLSQSFWYHFPRL